MKDKLLDLAIEDMQQVLYTTSYRVASFSQIIIDT